MSDISEENEGSENGAPDPWYNYLHKFLKLDESSQGENETSPCIFRVSPALLKECEDAYVPRIVSIGPYHHQVAGDDDPSFKKELYETERVKKEALSRVLARILLNKGTIRHNEQDKQLINSEMVKVLKEMEIKFTESHIEKCYDKVTSYTKEYLGEMMLLDACFILEFFRCLFNESVEDCENLERFFPKFGSNFNPVVRSEIMKDLIKLENQIPLFVLEEVLAREMGGSLERAKSSLQQLLKAVVCKFFYRPFDYVISGESITKNHILDIYYHCCLGAEQTRVGNQPAEEPVAENPTVEETPLGNPTAEVPFAENRTAEEPPVENRKEELWIFLGRYVEDLEKHQSERHKVPSAVQLKNGGVKIKASGRTLENITFEGKTLRIPPIKLESDSEIFIRNLIALEICSPHFSFKRMTTFAEFMHELCQTEEGAGVMREKGVIVGNLLQASEVTRLFRSCKLSHSPQSCHPIQIAQENLSEFYYTRKSIAVVGCWNEFWNTYGSKPWLVVGGLAAATVLALTAIQVHCLYHHCGPPG